MKYLKCENVRLYRGDTIQVAKHLAAKGFRANLVFADPPFNYDRKYDGISDKIDDRAYEEFTRSWIRAVYATLKPSGVLVVNIPDEHAAFIDQFVTRNLKMRRINWCIWHYRFGQNMKSKFCPSKAHVLVYAKGQSHTWNWSSILVPSDRAIIYKDKRTLHKKDGVPSGKRVPLDVWHGDGFSRVTGNSRERRKGHDNQLPEAYAARVIKAYTGKGDIVYDAFVGSGTFPTVAKHLKRVCYGAEQSAKYVRSAFIRVKEGPATL